MPFEGPAGPKWGESPPLFRVFTEIEVEIGVGNCQGSRRATEIRRECRWIGVTLETRPGDELAAALVTTGPVETPYLFGHFSMSRNLCVFTAIACFAFAAVGQTLPPGVQKTACGFCYIPTPPTPR